MNKEKKMTPEIRFPGFAGDWEELRLEDITKRVQGNDGRLDLPTLTISAENGWMDQEKRFSRNIAGKEQKNYTLLKKGQLSYNHGNSKRAKYGTVFELRTYKEALVPKVYHSFEMTKNADASFIEYLFATKIPDTELRKLITSGARMDGLLNINYDSFMSIAIKLPKYKEQTRLSAFFREIDSVITLHQHQLDDMKEYKKGLLQKMFPKKGEKVPELRFPGFTEPWEEKKLNDIIDKMTGGASIAPDDYVEEGVRTIPKGSVNDTGIADMSGCKNVSEEFFKKNISSKTSAGELVTSLRDLVPSAPNMGRIVRVIGNSEDFLMPQGVYSIILKENSDEDFLIAYSNSPQYRKIIAAEKNGSTQVHIRNGEYLNIDILIPSFDEQKKIGTLIKNLDTLITLHQQQLDDKKLYKKGLLQKMFV